MAYLNERIEGEVLRIELARPDRGNALSRALVSELAEAWNTFERDDALRVAVLHGTADVFSVGHDVAELAADAAACPVPDAAFYPIHLSKPVIAALEGSCFGLGFELALACDLRVAGEGARCGFVDAQLAVPYRVASVLLPRMTFLGTSLELLLSGRAFEAVELRELGLINELAAKGAAVARATELAHALARRFPAGADCRKHAIWRLSGLPLPAAMQLARAPR